MQELRSVTFNNDFVSSFEGDESGDLKPRQTPVNYIARRCRHLSASRRCWPGQMILPVKWKYKSQRISRILTSWAETC